MVSATDFHSVDSGSIPDGVTNIADKMSQSTHLSHKQGLAGCNSLVRNHLRKKIMFTTTKELLEVQTDLGESLGQMGNTINEMKDSTEKGRLLQVYEELVESYNNHKESTEQLLEAMDNYFSN